MKKRLCALLTALVMVLCAFSVLAEDADPVLVTVNGEEIRESNEMLQFWKSYVSDYYVNNYGVDPAEYAEVFQKDAMSYAVNYTVLRQKLAEEGTDFSVEAQKAYLKQEWDDIVAQFMNGLYGIGDDATEEDRAAAKADALAYIETNTGYNEEIYLGETGARPTIVLINNGLNEKTAGKTDVTDEEVEAYFQQKAESDKALIGDSALAYEYYPYYYQGEEPYYMPEGYRGVTHILLEVDEELLKAYTDLQAGLEEQKDPEQEGTEQAETEEKVTQEMVDAAKQAVLDSVQDKVEEIKGKLADGASFEDLILEYGTDAGMQDSATRAAGYAVHADSIMWESGFQKAAMALNAPGDISDPVVGSYGVHILQYLRDIPGGPVEFTDTIKGEIREKLQADKTNAAIDELTAPWISEAEIVWTEAGQAWKADEPAAAE